MAEVYAGVDLGGTKIACALGNIEQHIIAEKVIPTNSQDGPEAVLQRVGETISELAADAGQRPAALAMGVPGLADLQNGVVKFLPNLPGKWVDVDARGLTRHAEPRRLAKPETSKRAGELFLP